MQRQQTLAREVGCSGVGRITGRPVTLRLCPAPADTGRVIECDGGIRVPATLARSVASGEATALAVGNARVDGVEHVLAACFALGIDNLRLVVVGGEMPAMDGSAAAFVHLLHSAGRVAQSPARRCLRVRRELRVAEAGGVARIVPCDRLRLRYDADPSAGRPVVLDDVQGAGFERELAGARCGLAAGATPRFADEAARHDLLDLIGELSLLGAVLHAEIEIKRGARGLRRALVSMLGEERTRRGGAVVEQRVRPGFGRLRSASM